MAYVDVEVSSSDSRLGSPPDKLTLDIDSYKDGEISIKSRNPPIVVSNCKPWDVLGSLASLKIHVVIVSCQVIGRPSPNQFVLRIQVRGMFSLRTNNLLRSQIHPLASLCYRLDPTLSKLLPVQSYEEYSSGKHSFRLSSFYRSAHVVSTNKSCDSNQGVSLSSLESLFSSSTTKDKEVIIKPLPNASERAARHLGEKEKQRIACYNNNARLFLRLPIPLLHLVGTFLDPQSIRNYSRSCRYAHFSFSVVVPGLKLPLYSHQKQALRWMDSKETGNNLEFYNMTLEQKQLEHIARAPHLVRLPVSLASDDSMLVFDIAEAKFFPASSIEDNGGLRPTRGGFQCDEPGLGKTVTMLSLILRSAGLTTTLEKVEEVDPETLVFEMDLYWTKMESEQRKVLLNQLYCTLMARWYKIDAEYQDDEFLALAVDSIIAHIGRTSSRSHSSFSGWLQLCQEIFERFLPKSHDNPKVQVVRRKLSDLFEGEVLKTQRMHLADNVTSSRSCASRNRKIEETRKDKLITSGCTLIVVPKTLLSHWKAQIKRHVDNNVFNHSESFFFDEDVSLPLPSSKYLAGHVAVLTTIPRLTREESSKGTSLRGVKWLRLIVDEGHALGSGSISQYSKFLSRIHCEYKWVMTGTPAKQNYLDGLRGIVTLVEFIGGSIYSERRRKDNSHNGQMLWKKVVASPLKSGWVCGVIPIVALLQQFMIRHTKIDCAELPPLVLRNIRLTMGVGSSTDSEIDSYNALVTYAKTNILLTQMGDSDEGYDISLLNPNNSKLAREVINNIRISCSGGGKMYAYIRNEDWLETITLLREKYNASPSELSRANSFIQTITAGQVKPTCGSCGQRFPILFVSPCVHFFCVNCFSNKMANGYHCVVCQEPFSSGQFAALQPGFMLLWKQDSLNRGPRGTVVNLQRNRRPQTLTDSDGEEKGTKARYIVDRIKSLKKLDKSFKCIVYSQFRSVLNILGHHMVLDPELGCDSVAEFFGHHRDLELNKFVHNEKKEWHCHHCGHVNEPMFRRCERLKLKLENVNDPADTLSGYADELVENYFMGMRFVYGQTVLTKKYYPSRGGVLSTSVDEMDGVHKIMKVVESEKCRGQSKSSRWSSRNNLDCYILLLSKDGSTGLDLSMVNHIFLVDKVWDFSMLDQIVSRAWRLGTKASKIDVEQLYLKDTIEQLMFEYEEVEDRDVNKKEFGRVRYLLTNMKVLTKDILQKGEMETEEEKGKEDVDCCDGQEAEVVVEEVKRKKKKKQRTVRFADDM